MRRTMDADIDTLGLKDLKALIAQAGLKFDDCIDKADLRARARCTTTTAGTRKRR